VAQIEGPLGEAKEAFYHAEALRVFARDTVPPGTFEGLQEDIYTGIIDEHDAHHPDGYTRVLKVTKTARELSLTSNALLTCSGPKTGKEYVISLQMRTVLNGQDRRTETRHL